MSYIQFESAREKEKIREELRNVREQLLEKAKKNAEEKAKQKIQSDLRGESNWMLPAVAEKIEKLSKNSKVSKKSKKKKESKKKSSKAKSSKRKKKQKQSSSDDSDTESDDSSSCSEDDRKARKKARKQKKSKGRHEREGASSDSSAGHKIKRTSKKKQWESSESSSSSSEETEQPQQWVEKAAAGGALNRDSWMTDSTLMLKTFERDRKEKKPNEKQQIDAYDPAKSTRELNPYWKLTGTGLPSFQKPKDDNDYDYDDGVGAERGQRPRGSGGFGGQTGKSSTRNWQKKVEAEAEAEADTKGHKKQRPPSPVSGSSSRSRSPSPAEEHRQTDDEERTAENQAQASSFLTDQQMNELAAKILKAEILGNTDLAKELKEKLQSARSNRTAFKERKVEKVERAQRQKEEHILLTHTDERGNSRPLARSGAPFDTRDLYGGRKGSKKQSKRAETHANGERVRFFPDDDKYDIKQMFEREKYSTAADSNLEFANIVSKHKNPNDDLEDIFADKIRKNISQEQSEQKQLHRAMHESQRLATQLENCDKCFDSEKMDKKLLVCMGEKVYLALPWYNGLVAGHCVLVPTQHVTCATQLDEDAWEELTNFRKALTRMFAAQKKDVIFYEIANKLHRRPHLTIHCIPIPDSDGEMAPFYFKKAIEESEQEWCVNKQLVSLRNRNLRSAIPKGLPYFWVHFGMDTGFAHVIEDQHRFPTNFAQEIIGGMLHLDAHKWRKPHKESNIIPKVKMFADWWKKYDCTN